MKASRQIYAYLTTRDWPQEALPATGFGSGVPGQPRDPQALPGPSWCQQVSKMENQMLNLLLLPLPQAALGVVAGEVPFVQLKWPACAPPASMVIAVWGSACA